MNKIKLKNPGYLAPLFLALGLVGMFLYKWLFAYVEDPVSGLLPAFTVPEILLWVLTAGVCAAAFVLTQGTTFGRMGTSVPAVSDVLFAVGFVTQFLADAEADTVGWMAQASHTDCRGQRVCRPIAKRHCPAVLPPLRFALHRITLPAAWRLPPAAAGESSTPEGNAFPMHTGGDNIFPLPLEIWSARPHRTVSPPMCQ